MYFMGGGNNFVQNIVFYMLFVNEYSDVDLCALQPRKLDNLKI